MISSALLTRFQTGRLFATPAALAALAAPLEHNITPLSLLTHHVSGDFGHISHADLQANEHAIEHGGRILSSYQLEPGCALCAWVITEADRSSTCVLMPDDY